MDESRVEDYFVMLAADEVGDGRSQLGSAVPLGADEVVIGPEVPAFTKFVIYTRSSLCEQRAKAATAATAAAASHIAFCQVSQNQSAGTAAATSVLCIKVLTPSDSAEKQKTLSAELTIGRLALITIIAMFFQVSLTDKQKKLPAELTNGRLPLTTIIGMFFQDCLTDKQQKHSAEMNNGQLAFTTFLPMLFQGSSTLTAPGAT
jgi:hypothetical protein